MSTSSVLKNLGRLHISAGTVTYTSGVPSLTTNDGAASIADTAENNATITFDPPFLSAPSVVVAYLKGTHSNQEAHTVTVEQATTTTVEFRIHDLIDDGLGATDVFSTGDTNDPADGDGFSYVVIGTRNN